jgi:hypothetical protein
MLAFIGLFWAVAAVYVHGWVMLAYPAMWCVVGLLFLGLNTAYNSLHPAETRRHEAEARP